MDLLVKFAIRAIQERGWTLENSNFESEQEEGKMVFIFIKKIEHEK